MQGRITKVLNMKPIEILSMIEEAAGTRMYETKKQSAIKTIEKKQLKVNELSRILDEDITPRLQQLRQEKENYQAWSTTSHEVEKLERLSFAYEYCEAETKVNNAENYQQEMKIEILSLQKLQEKLQDEISEIENEIREIEKKREDEQDGVCQSLKKKEGELSKELVKINTNFQNMKMNLKKEHEVCDGVLQQIEQNKEFIEEKEREISHQHTLITQLHSNILHHQHEVDTLQMKYQNACAGVVDTSESSNQETISTLSLVEQIGVWETKLRESQSKGQQERLKFKYNQKKLKELNESKRNEEKNYQRERQKLERLREEIRGEEERMTQLFPSSSTTTTTSAPSLIEREQTLRLHHEELQSQMLTLYDQLENITTQIQTRLNFEFRDPEKNFDRSRVKGLVANLVSVKDAMRHSTPLEIAAGNKLYQVVVDNEQTGKLLLSKGVLRKRVTILPLNKISHRIIERNKLSLASNIAHHHNGSAELALELVGYDDEVINAMQHVFGNAIICSSSQIAEAITFDPAIRCRTITYDGDTFDPSGTITGGSRNQIGALLMKMNEMSELKSRYEEMREQNQHLERELEGLDEINKTQFQSQQKIQLKLHEIQILEERLATSSYQQIDQEMQELEREIQQFDQVSRSLPSPSHLSSHLSPPSPPLSYTTGNFSKFGSSRGTSSIRITKT
jgi:structural maintenance of chromosome 2